MKAANVLTVVFLVTNVSTIENRKKPLKDKLGYNPAELLANIFNSNTTTESRESRYNTLQLGKDFIEDYDHDELQTDIKKNKDQFDNVDDDFLNTDADEQNITEKDVKNILHLDKEASRSANKAIWKNNNDLRTGYSDDYDEESRSDFKRQKNKKRKPRVQFNYEQNYPVIGTNPLTSNQYGLLPAHQSPISPSQLGFVSNVPNGYSGYYPHGAAGQYTGHPVPVNPFIPKQIGSGAFSAIVDAFTSIAQNDDYQCVPRLLCETAGGAVGSNKILESVTNLQPLFAMLANYQGLSTSALFLFGRAVFLGMTSKGNPSSCRYAYPQCPNDPDKLVHYLNNHKGGFFRFFSNIKENPNYSSQGHNFQSYGLYQPSRTDQKGLGYGLYDGQKQYGDNYAYHKINEEKEVDSDSITHARIQNKPSNSLNNFDVKNKWLFPDDVRYDDNIRIANKLKFPSHESSPSDDTNDDFDRIKNHKRKVKSIAFPENNNDDRFINKLIFNNNNNELYNKVYNRYVDKEESDYVFDYAHNFYVKREQKTVKYRQDEDDVKTVYIVRGNSDPRHPEIVKLRPGQSIQSKQ